MTQSLLEEWITAVRHEARNHKGKVGLCFAVVTFLMLGVGWNWPNKYEASAVIFADEENIIQPLLKGSAEVTRLNVDHQKLVREKIYSRQIIEHAIESLKEAGSATVDKLSVSDIRSGLQIKDVGREHFKISFLSADPQISYDVTSSVVQAFIEDSAKSKRAESKEAYSFIDRQVKAYKQQLQDAEGRLKQFKSQNTDGSEMATDRRKDELRTTLEELKLNLAEAQTRRDELQLQLSRETKFLAKNRKADVLRERLAAAEQQLDALRLQYEDTYPDIVNLRDQIQELQRSIYATENEPADTDSGVGGTTNPVHEQLRTRMAETEIDIRTLKLRIKATENMVNEEQSRAERIAEHQAELSELTRDYDVTKQIYEDMLSRKERARLSMTLDIEGQGVSFKIQDPALFPNNPVGLRFIHFFLAAPLVAIALPLGFMGAFVQLDPRYRFTSSLQRDLPKHVPVLAVIPHYSSAAERRGQRARWFGMGVLAVSVLIVYGIVGAIRISGGVL